METSLGAPAPRGAALDGPIEASKSAVSWAAILAGSVGAVSATIILLTLGSGLGFASISPWTHSGASATTVGALAAVWFIVVQWLSAGLGGYLTGRLRTKWVGTHTHEAFFRDTPPAFALCALPQLNLRLVVPVTALGSAAAGVRPPAMGGGGPGQGATIPPHG